MQRERGWGGGQTIWHAQFTWQNIVDISYLMIWWQITFSKEFIMQQNMFDCISRYWTAEAMWSPAISLRLKTIETIILSKPLCSRRRTLVIWLDIPPTFDKTESCNLWSLHRFYNPNSAKRKKKERKNGNDLKATLVVNFTTTKQ